MNATARPMVLGSLSTSDQWRTPRFLAELLGPFDTDPCSHPESHIQATHRYFGESDADDGLKAEWRGSVFANYPYSSPRPWCDRLAAHTGPWCALIKLDPSTRAWATLMSANPTVAPFRKRLRFEGDKAMTANFPSVLVYRRWAPSAELEQHLWLARYA